VHDLIFAVNVTVFLADAESCTSITDDLSRITDLPRATAKTICQSAKGNKIQRYHDYLNGYHWPHVGLAAQGPIAKV